MKKNLIKIILLFLLVISTSYANIESQKEVPYLDVKHEVIFDNLKSFRTANGLIHNEMRVMLARTDIKWLDDILRNELEKLIYYDLHFKNLDELKKSLNEKFHKKIDEMIENEMRSSTYGAVIKYLGQKGNIVSFIGISMDNSLDYRNMGEEKYIHIDVNKKKNLELKDIIKNYEVNNEIISDLLKKNFYDDYAVDTNLEYDGLIPDNFYFSDRGLVFVFGAYQMTGTFSDLGSSLLIRWKDINELLKEEYKKPDLEISIFDGWYDYY